MHLYTDRSCTADETSAAYTAASTAGKGRSEYSGRALHKSEYPAAEAEQPEYRVARVPGSRSTPSPVQAPSSQDILSRHSTPARVRAASRAAILSRQSTQDKVSQVRILSQHQDLLTLRK